MVGERSTKVTNQCVLYVSDWNAVVHLDALLSLSSPSLFFIYLFTELQSIGGSKCERACAANISVCSALFITAGALESIADMASSFLCTNAYTLTNSK